MPKFRKKPIIIEAMQFTGRNVEDVLDWMLANGNKGVAGGHNYNDGYGDNGRMYIDTLEGKMIANVNDWIICGINGEFYPCKQDIFEKTYEVIDA